MNKLRSLGLVIAALAVGSGAVTVWSAATSAPSEPDRAPVAPWQERRNRPDGMRPDGLRPGRPGEWLRDRTGPSTRPVSAEEWQDVDRFMNNYSKKRWKKFNEMPDDERKDRLRGFVTARYRAMQELKKNDPTMYDLRLRRLKIEDEIFELGWQLNHDPDKAEETRSKLREQVRALIDSRIEEHKLRVNQLQERLKQEEERLAAETTNKDKIIETSMGAIEKQRWPGMGEMVPPVGGGPRNFGPVNTSQQGEKP